MTWPDNKNPPDAPLAPSKTVPAPPPLPAARPGARLGRYEILDELGRGSMGIVYRARHLDLNVERALKLLRDPGPDMVLRFENEARSMARLRHPGIVAVHEIAVEDGHHFFTMDLIRGGSLQDAMSRRRLPQRDRIAVLEQVARAVHAAHENGIIHRDLKPGNVMLESDGRPVITDFGLARAVDRTTRLTREGAAVGTPHYMAPEQVRGQTQAVGPHTDVYSLGVMLYELICDAVPFSGASVAAVYGSILTDDPRPMRPGTPQELKTVCLKAMEREPERRYASAQTLAEDLGCWLSGRPITARPASTIRRVVVQARRHRAAIVVGAAVFVALAAVLAYVERSREADEQARRQREEKARRDEAVKHVELGRERLDAARLALYRRGSDLRDRHAKIQEAIALFEKAAPLVPEAHYHVGRAHAMLYGELSDDAEFAAADAAFRAALARRADFALARLGRGLLYAERVADELIVAFFAGEDLANPPPERRALCDTAAAELGAALRERAGTPRDQHAAEIALAVSRGEFDRAVEMCGAGWEAYDAEEFLVMRSRLRLFRRDYDAALSDARTAREKQANMPGAIACEYSCLFMTAQFDESLRVMDEYLRLHPEHAPTLLTRAMAQSYAGQAARGLEDIERVQKSGALPGRTQSQRALLLTLLGRHAEAVEEAREGARLCERQPAAHVTLSAVLTAVGKLAESEAAAARALELNPRYPGAYAARAMLRMIQMRFDDALADAGRALELDPFAADACTVRGLVYARKGEFAKARADLERAIRLNPFQKKLIEPVLEAIRRAGE